MKKILLLSIIFATSIITAAPALAKGDNLSLRICEYVQANDKSRLRTFLKQKKLKVRNIFDQLKCNNHNILIFAAKSKALEVGEFIIGKLPSKTVKTHIDEIEKYSAHLAEEAKER